ncbi:DEAD/DEAH box helicase [Novipirellula caenicola]|uniref:Ski2-like helicase n=1 Tax=Novipirellula caenicola TaxID=1536901 RepID=A0ABP9VNE6_9BACT
MPIDRKLADSLFERIPVEGQIQADVFEVASDLCTIVNQDAESADAHELVLRAMEHRGEFGEFDGIIDGLVRRLGLFPYLDPTDLSIADLLAYEAHRPDNMEKKLVFHRAQAHVYHLLMSGENVALSAPTSFGKSLIIDAAIASGKYDNIVIVVPTLALIDETRRRLTKKFAGEFKVITRSSQAQTKRNIFVMTQERVLESEDWSFVDFFVIDEFYKLFPRDGNDDRAGLLNQAFYVLAKSGAQFYMLGPDIRGVTDQDHIGVELKVVHHPNYHTVATQIHRMQFGEDENASLVELCRQLDSKTIIFCSSPNRASRVARALVEAGLGNTSDETKEAAKWIGENFHPEWHFPIALANGIGIHHGRVPRALAQYVVRKFNEGELDFLVCTSTLIEGVNTKAKNIVILDNQINRVDIDRFTFNNIMGRSGRMFEFFVGHVYVFHDDPQTQLPFVDVPALSQSEAASDSLIVQMDDDDLTEVSRARVQRFVDDPYLSFEVIQQNKGVDPQQQINAAQLIAESGDEYKANLSWTRWPTYQQLRQICELIFSEFNGHRLGSGSAVSASQLTFLTWRLRDRPSIRELIEAQLKRDEPDVAVQKVLDFLRLWANFHLPRLLRTISLIQEDVLEREGLETGNYFWFAAQVENYFVDAGLVALEEFGVPIQTALQLENEIAAEGDLDATLENLKDLDVDILPISEFEKELLEDSISHL